VEQDGIVNPAPPVLLIAARVRASLFERGLCRGYVDGENTSRGRPGIVFAAITVEHEVTSAKDCPVAFVQFALKDQKLLMTVVAVAARAHTGRHAIDMEPLAQWSIIIELQDAVAHCHPIRIDEGREAGIVNIGDPAFAGLNRFQSVSPGQVLRVLLILNAKSIQRQS